MKPKTKHMRSCWRYRDWNKALHAFEAQRAPAFTGKSRSVRGPLWATCIAIPVVYRYVRTCHPRLIVLIAVSYLHASLSTFSDSTAAFSSSVFSTAAGSSVEPLLWGRSCSSRARSFLKSGRNRSIRFHDSDHSFSFDGSWLGGTRYPLLDMNKSTFFRFSGTASSCTS